MLQASLRQRNAELENENSNLQANFPVAATLREANVLYAPAGFRP
jgi:hypothetical protein